MNDAIEKAANGIPIMSVVVITPDGYETISAVLRHVHAQSVKEQLEIVIVAPASDALQLNIHDFDTGSMACVS